ncbi:class II histone deacetylase complex subunits 2 and 3-domain-containing protein [Aspergillus keveii]|uniref:Class II histone deacetylase complex subunits 2 and 3-domain-containing protein n=1 Tax=Aspergillus keveii TaxID=714993 RepID=A0ABR4FUF4_9EURO
MMRSVFTGSPNKSRRNNWNNQFIVTSSDDEDEEEDSNSEELDDEEWEINGILDESESQYLIDWVGNYPPSWEPKENASESAIHIWNSRKKQKEDQLASQRHEPAPAQSHTPPANEQRLETLEQDTAVQNTPDSPLFVSPDPVTQAYTQETHDLSQSSFGRQDYNRTYDIKKPTTKRPPHVFEYCARSPIPSEYLLPGESEEPFSSVQHTTATTRTSTPEARGSLNLDSPTTENVRPTEPRPPTITQSSPRTEIPETPSILLNLQPTGGSQTNPNRAASSPRRTVALPTHSPHTLSSQNSGLSRSPATVHRRSTPDNFTPSVSPTRPETGHTASIPETLLARNSVPSLSQSPTALATQHSINPRTFTPSAPFANLRNIIGRTVSLPARGTFNTSRFPTPRVSETAATMNDESQKGALSLKETLEKYSHLEGATPREKMRNLWASTRERSTLEPQPIEPSATPSSVGDIEPSAPLSIPETVAPLSVRVDKDTSHHPGPLKEPTLEPLPDSVPEPHVVQTIQPSALTITYQAQVTPGSLHLGPSEFAVPLPMDSRVKDDYEKVLTEGQHIIYALINEESFSLNSGTEKSSVVSSAERMLERLSNAATHPDLNFGEHLKDADENLENQATWAEYSSAKFLLLSYLIKAQASDEHEMHLVIAVRAEKTQRVVERYLEGKGFTYTRPRVDMGSGTSVEVSMAKGSMSFGIQNAQDEGIMEAYKPPLAVIAFDSSLDVKKPSMEHMRTTFARNGHLLPVIRLIVANSSEHVELCFPGPSTSQKHALVFKYIRQLRDIIGDLQDDALGVQEDATEILACLLSDNFNLHWKLPPVEALRQIIEDEGFIKPSTQISKPVNPTAQKRVFMSDTSEPAPKRPRMEESQETSQFTDISGGPTQTLNGKLLDFGEQVVQKKNSDAARIETLENELAANQSRLQERDKILESLQHRYETRTKDLHKLRQERDRLFETKTTAEQRLQRQKEEMSKLKDERTELRHELEKAREALKAGGGDMAELEKGREEIRRLTKENAGLERKSEYEHKQAEYTREQYQTASNVAAQSATELRTLKEENEALKRKVAGEASRLRELNIKSDESRHLARIAELEALLSSREDLLHRKEDELREIRRNRPSTRSTSTQPRSPKLTAGNSRPTSPGINNNGNTFPGRGSALRFSSEMSF